MAGYILGMPLAQVSVNPAASAVAFYDTREEQRRVLGVDVVRPRGYVSSNAPLEAIAIVSLAGIMSEIDEFGDAEGGTADLSQLQAIYDTTSMSADDQFQMTRWAALQAHLLLKRNAAALEILVAAFIAAEFDTPSVGACIRAIEEGAPHADVAALRLANRVSPTPLERILVRTSRHLDWGHPADNDSVAPFSWRERLPSWSPDDVPFLAFSTTMLFVLYAVNGGVTLH